MNHRSDKERCVIFLKEHDNKYSDALEHIQTEVPLQRKLIARFAQVLTFEYVNRPQLCDTLIHLEARHAGIIITSPRASMAIAEAIKDIPEPSYCDVIRQLRGTALFSVGAATSSNLHQLGISCNGEGSGSADALADHLFHDGILPLSHTTKPLLFLCGDKRRDSIPSAFQQRNLPLIELKVYESCPIEDFRFPDGVGVPAWIAFFSPSGLKAVQNVPLPWPLIRKAAIGNTTASALQKYADTTRQMHWKAQAIAVAPNSDALARAIVEYEHNHPIQSSSRLEL
uniref:Uroporphyrinogen-III synthase n=1 Tax=Albugo laibachii Nc14 TaxID=890382 RepID=F0WXD7_9STRA|nr:uroporphyrinogenIII synthase putative [Albugo laibachii Nc14]|eukprot:CCA26129.1 uroporphyrinogenIII synthase putative [Albugo laibachii Nc14]